MALKLLHIIDMKKLLLIIIAVAVSLSLARGADAIMVDGFLGVNEYSNSFTAGWYSGHNTAGSQFQKADDHTTTVYWESTNTNFYLYMEAPLEAKNMIWGSGFTEDEALSYYQHWCSPNDGNPAALDGSNCGHHKDGFDKFKTQKGDFKL